MGWKVVERRIGKAGPLKRRSIRQHEWDQRYGEGNWEIGYVLDGEFVSQDAALESVYYRSYELHFEEHPEDLRDLIGLTKALRNPHAEATTGVDLQVPAITEYLRRHGHALKGAERVDIGSWEGQASHAISVRLSPLQIRCAVEQRMTLEQFWQEKKCLAAWEDAD
ncbi:MAG: hypothetical protein ACO1SX_22355 [Actinomycetota bacterium]